MVYKPKAESTPETKPAEEVKAVELSLGGAQGGLFKPLPGLKVLDSKLMNQPNFQKIAQMQSEEEKKTE